MKYLFAILFPFLAGIAVGAEMNTPSIIPVPEKMEVSKGQFQLGPATRIAVDGAPGETGAYLAGRMRASTGYLLPVLTINQEVSKKEVIRLTTNGANAALGDEGYELSVAPGVISITAPTQAGLFYGVQTLLQLFPPEIFASKVVTNVAWEIPYAVHIEDQPRFKWRGFMLDVSRHFFTKDEVKRVLDEMALQKLNTFHWHLTDDNGWRIEIKKYPNLTKVGAWRRNAALKPDPDDAANTNNIQPAWDAYSPAVFGPDGRYGGFYTQDEVREVVAYAAARHIMVVPEIEMPGHAIAALASYPNLSCMGTNFSTNIDAGASRGVFCVGNDEVYQFIDGVLSEVFELFPSKYVHVGGDEVDTNAKKATWGKSPECMALMKSEGFTNINQLQGMFTARVAKFVNEHGKTLLGWSEIADSPLPGDTVVMDWVGGATKAATNGHDVVMSPTGYCYLDYYQSIDRGTEPSAASWGGALTLEKVYAFEPIPSGLAPEFQSHILGGQCNLWTEYVPSLAHVEYMAFPRLCALAEVTWSPKASHNWNDFNQRLQVHELRLAEFGVNFRRDPSVKIGEWTPAQLSAGTNGTAFEWDATVKAAGEYRVVFHFTRGSGLNIKSVSLLENGKEVVTDAHAGFAARNPSNPVYLLNLPAVSEGAKYTVRASVAGTGSSGTVTSWFNPEHHLTTGSTN